MNKILSLIATPLIIFIVTTNTLWLKNQRDLNYNLELLLPFVGLFFLSLIIGCLLLRLSNYKPFQYLLWSYYFIGPFFLLYNYLRKIPFLFLETGGGVFLFLVVFLIATIILTLKIKPLSALHFFSIFGSLLLLLEIYQFIDKYRPLESPNFSAVRQISPEVKDRKLPNIYHILFDEFQTDKFVITLTPEVKKQFSGFVFFPENTTIYGRTGMSVSSILQGKSYDFISPQTDYQTNAFNSESSILYWLKMAGYSTHFYLHVNLEERKLIDFLTVHSQYAKVDDFRLLFPAFRKLWIYANLPEYISRHFTDQKEIAHLKNKNLLSDSVLTTSYHAFRRYLNDEGNLPDSNRYTYIHLIIPHFPDIFSSDCSYTKDLKKTNTLEQSRCATLLMVKFIQKLKELKRFDNSLIIISADHGSWYILKDGELVSLDQDYYGLEWSRARSRTLLLIKPAGTSDNTEMVVSNAESTLLDIAPSIVRAISLPVNMEFEGISLVDPVQLSLKRRRYYYFYDKNNHSELTNEMTRFIIENGEISLDRKVKVNPGRRLGVKK